MASRSPDKNLLPLFYEGDIVTGTVSVDLKSKEPIREISVTLQGLILGAGQDLEPYTFLSVPETLWAQTNGKISGTYSWTFSINIPREVVIPGNAQTPPRSYPLPPRFSERGSQAHIDYRIVVSVRRRRFSADSTLFTPIVYLPYSIAGVPSLKRQAAYRAGVLPPGPRADPEGWKILPSCETIGKLLSTRSVSTSIHCRLAIAMPLSYAASTCIPIHVSLRTGEPHVAELLTRDSILVQLVRKLDIQDFTATRRSMSFHDVMSEGVFWPAPDDRTAPGERHFFGEIPLRKKLTSSFDFSKLSVNYKVALFPVRAPQYTVASPDEPLLSEPIEITLRNPHGISPRSYSPPESPLSSGLSPYHRDASRRYERSSYLGFPSVGGFD
ncbi:unnamed protein product [Peniophora sp. CBMAI 1063]|nr:unnamed protein product [Peniophora sp. CBMAI 1063]